MGFAWEVRVTEGDCSIKELAAAHGLPWRGMRIETLSALLTAIPFTALKLLPAAKTVYTQFVRCPCTSRILLESPNWHRLGN